MKDLPLEVAINRVGKGWAPLVAMVYGARQMIPGQINIIDVKQKYGGLRINTDYMTDSLWKVISEVELKSFRICEVCGAAGELLKTQENVYMTRCEEHRPEQFQIISPF